MKPAMYATVKLTDEPAESILIPTSAILQEEEQAYVLVSSGNNKFLKRKVETSATDGDKSVITSGLQSGEKYVSDGAFVSSCECSYHNLYSGRFKRRAQCRKSIAAVGRERCFS